MCLHGRTTLINSKTPEAKQNKRYNFNTCQMKSDRQRGKGVSELLGVRFEFWGRGLICRHREDSKELEIFFNTRHATAGGRVIF